MATGLWANTPVTQAGPSEHCTLLLYIPLGYSFKTGALMLHIVRKPLEVNCHRKVLLIHESGIRQWALSEVTQTL